MSEDALNNEGASGAGQQGGENGDRNGTGAASNGAPASFDEWLNGQADEVKSLVTGSIGKLQNALNDERTQRRSLAKQIDDLSKQAEQGSQLRAQLEKLSGDFESASRKATFYESAPAEVTNLRLAWLVANDADLIDKDGKTNWAALRTAAPELFKRVTPPANAGAGAKQTGVDDGRSMNAFIRAASGRGG
jgi:hypothetical protein